MPKEPIAHDPIDAEEKRNLALARYDAHPGIAITLLVVMAVIFGVATYQLVYDRQTGDGFGPPQPASKEREAK